METKWIKVIYNTTWARKQIDASQKNASKAICTLYLFFKLFLKRVNKNSLTFVCMYLFTTDVIKVVVEELVIYRYYLCLAYITKCLFSVSCFLLSLLSYDDLYDVHKNSFNTVVHGAMSIQIILNNF